MALSISRQKTSLLALSSALSLALWTPACVQDLDVGGGGAGGAGGTGGSAATTSAPLCASGDVASCYEGPSGTEGVAACHSGTRECAADGFSWGPCVGQVLPDFEACAAPADMSCDGTTACTEPTGWSLPFEGDPPETARFTAAAVGPDHALYVAGTHPELAAPGEDGTVPPNAFLAKIAPNGDVLWKVEYDSLNSRIGVLSVDHAGNVIAAGWLGDRIDFGGGALTNPAFANDGPELPFVARLDPAGKEIWTRTFDLHNGGYPQFGVGADLAGNVIINATFQGTVDIGGALVTAQQDGYDLDVFVAKLAPDGHTVFARRWGIVGEPVAPWIIHSFRVGASGGFVMSGEFAGDLDVGGPAPLHSDIVGDPPSGPTGSYVAAYDSDGQLVWQRAYTGRYASQVGISATGEVVATGPLQSDTDFGGGALEVSGDPDRAFLARWDAAGNHLRSRAFHAGGLSLAPFGVHDDGTTSFVGIYLLNGDLAGLGGPTYDGEKALGNVLFRTGKDDMITRVWSWHYPVPSNLDLLSVHARDDGSGGIYAAGLYSGAVDVGFGPLPASASRAFVAHYVP